MDLLPAFDAQIYVPPITTLEEIDSVLSQLSPPPFSDGERGRIMGLLRESGVEGRLSIGVKKLVYVVEMSVRSEERVERFVEGVGECVR